MTIPDKPRPRPVRTRERHPLPKLAPTSEKQDLQFVGKSVPRVDARDKVTGQTRYAEDIQIPGALVARVLRTAYPHALIRRVDTDRARQVPGVHAVLTHLDVPGRKIYGVFRPHQPLLAIDRVRYWGDAIAMVAAETDAAARRALDLIDVDYDPLPVVGNPLDALEPNAPAIHGDTNLAFTFKLRKGDVAAGFQQADAVVERVYRLRFVDHAPIEPMAALAVPRGDGGLTLSCPTQLPFIARNEVAAVLGLDPSRIDLDFTLMGGGFGGKEDISIEACCRVALLALKTGRPVRIVYSREEQMRVAPKRHPMTITHRLGATRDGRLVAADVTVYVEMGAYESTSRGISLRACVLATGPYVVPNVKVDVHAVYTNNPPAGAMRGVGAPQVHFAAESQVDELAERLDLDPIDFRLLNALDAGEATATGQVLEYSVGLKETIEKAAGRSELRRRWHGWRPDPAPGRFARGIGVAASYFGLAAAAGPEAGTAVVRARADGRVEIDTGVGEVGQGSSTVLAQIAAEAMEVPLESIVVPAPDTARSPFYGTTSASRATTIAGNGVFAAGREARRVLLEHGARKLGLGADRVEWRRGRIVAGERSVDLPDLVRELWERGEPVIARTRWVPPQHSYDVETGTGEPFFIYAFATAVAAVVVDRQTGEIAVEKITIAQDVGKAINPQSLTGQIEGAVSMGLGYALMEEQLWSGGRSVATDLHNYTLPTACDMPEIDVILVEDPSPYGPFGAKGAGEPPVVPIAPAIANAVHNAVGVRLRDLPITAEKVLQALRTADH